MHVSAPIFVQSRIAGVLTVAKPTRTVQRFIDRAEHKVLMGGLLLLALSAAVGVAVTLWMVWNVRRLRDYALSVQGPEASAQAAAATRRSVPQVPGELGDLARAMDACASGWRGMATSRPMCAPSPTNSKPGGRHPRRGRTAAGRPARRRPRSLPPGGTAKRAPAAPD